jgi:poly(beta-D-mannuronate) C5 epimerase
VTNLWKMALVVALFAMAIGLPTIAVTTTAEPPAGATGTSCTTPIHYASSSNAIYLVAPPAGGGAWTPTLIKQTCPIAPITEVDPVNQVWELSGNLVLQNGTSLDLHAGSAPGGGDVNTLELESGADNLPTDVVALTLAYGTMDVNGTTITSWDNAADGPDTNVNLPSGAPSTDRGRAFINAETTVDASGTPTNRSSMTFKDSTVEYLGYYGSESYGVSYKTEVCSHTTPSECIAADQVTGSETDSTFEHDFMGTYAWGADNMTFEGNQYYDNIMYGLDTHDVSRSLLITDNHSSYNGDHGIICSEACDHLTITDNTVDHNGLVPWTGPDPDVDVEGEVHGIMLHRGVTNSVVEGNDVYDQPTGAGIAIFDTDSDTIEDNTITDNLFGIRMSVGSSDDLFENNTVSDDANYPSGDAPEYGIYEYVGSNAPYYNPTGVPTGNIYTDNSFNFDNMGANPVKLSGAVGTAISNDTFLHPVGAVIIATGTGNTFTGNTFPASQEFKVTGASGQPGGAVVTNSTLALKAEVDTYSRIDVDSTSGQLYSPAKGTPTTTESSTGSDLALTSAAIGTGSVVVTPLPLAMAPSSGTVQATGASTSKTKTMGVTTPAAGTSVTLTATGLSPNAKYVVKRGSTTLATVVADPTGKVTYVDGPLAQGTFSYTISAS